jgi:hypothetical protein
MRYFLRLWARRRSPMSAMGSDSGCSAPAAAQRTSRRAPAPCSRTAVRASHRLQPSAERRVARGVAYGTRPVESLCDTRVVKVGRARPGLRLGLALRERHGISTFVAAGRDTVVQARTVVVARRVDVRRGAIEDSGLVREADFEVLQTLRARAVGVALGRGKRRACGGIRSVGARGGCGLKLGSRTDHLANGDLLLQRSRATRIRQGALKAGASAGGCVDVASRRRVGRGAVGTRLVSTLRVGCPRMTDAARVAAANTKLDAAAGRVEPGT